VLSHLLHLIDLSGAEATAAYQCSRQGREYADRT
jgi:hypothetical protein